MHENISGSPKGIDGMFDAPELEFSQLVAEFDAADSNLTMAYGRYMEKPSPRRMRDIDREAEASFDAFGDLIQQMMSQRGDDVAGEDSRPMTFANLLVAMTQKHAHLLAEYTDFVEASDDDDARDETLLIAGLFEEFDDDALVEAVLDNFKEIRANDMEAIQRYMLERKESPYQVIKEKALRGSIDITKIGTGVLVGMMAYEKLMKRSGR